MSTQVPSGPSKSNSNQITTFDQFWLHYLREHAAVQTRVLHFSGLILALAGATLLVMLNAPLYAFLGVPIVPYALAWSGHFFYEHNQPTTFRHPMWSFISYFRMFRYWLMGKLPGELKRAGITG